MLRQSTLPVLFSKLILRIMKELQDLAFHQFDVKSPTNVPNYINFKAPLLGEGTLGCIAPNSEVSILYLYCKPTENFIWHVNQAWKRDDAFFFNYFLKAPEGLKTITTEKKVSKLLIDNTLLADGTNSTSQSLVMVQDEPFEFFQVSLSVEFYESLRRRYLADFSQDIKELCCRKRNEISRNVITLPIESREEICIREITKCPFDSKLQNQFSLLKVNELIIYYFQRMVNGGVLEENENFNSEVKVKENLIKVKQYLDNYPMKKFNYDFLCNISGMNPEELNQLFRDVFGYSISKYHRSQKLNRAYNMLLDIDKNISVNETAFELGFSSVSSFSRAFYNEFKIRPSELKLTPKT